MAVLVTQQVLKTTQYHQKPGRLLAKNLCKNNHFFLCPCFALVWSCKRSCAGHSPHPHHLMVQWRQVEFGRQVEERTRRLATAAIAHTQSFAYTYTALHSLPHTHTLLENSYTENTGVEDEGNLRDCTPSPPPPPSPRCRN